MRPNHRNSDTKQRSNLTPSLKNPRRVRAGRQNWAKRSPLTEKGRSRLRESALRHKPWRFSTGPRTTRGKQIAAQNGKRRQLGPFSIREFRADVANLNAMVKSMRDLRRQVTGI
jgi:hypothetical protein